MDVKFVLPQPALQGSIPLPYTSSPFALCWYDVLLFVKEFWTVPFIVSPLWPCHSGPLDELYPSPANLYDITLHFLLILLQSAIVVAAPCALLASVFSPLGPIVLVLAIALVFNFMVCKLLNGTQSYFESHGGNTRPEHEDEYWMFLNGVSVGHNWLQSNIDRLSMTFGRKIHGVHNPTYGIIFDLIQCIIQRDFCYFTQDVRDAYKVVREALFNARYKKLVFIIHSQGGIEGGMILDWLLADVPTDLMNQLEVYTFGNAANHFNNPHQHLPSLGPSPDGPSKPNKKTISHMEHYTNSKDFVSRWGVLHFVGHKSTQKDQNRYMGRVFERPAKGHLLNQHYLDYMFPLENGKVVENGENVFMNLPIHVGDSGEDWWTSALNGSAAAGASGPVCNVYDTTTPVDTRTPRDFPAVLRVKDLSRLWKYRNGLIPDDEDDEDEEAYRTISRKGTMTINRVQSL